jgi:hypothetical protein
MRYPPRTERQLTTRERCAISASADRRPKDVVILPIVVSELEFRDVERQVLMADLVERREQPSLLSASLAAT